MKWINRTLISAIIVLLIVAVLIAVLGFYTTGGKMEVGSWADWVSALSTFGTLGIAFAAYKKAPEWLNQSRVNQTKEFINVMSHVNSKVCDLVLKNYDTDHNIIRIMAIPIFIPADEQIKIIKLIIPKEKHKELESEYKKFKDNTVNAYIEARDNSQVEDHEHKSYPDFYQYIASLKIAK